MKNRKPIRDMNFEEILNFILVTKPKDDWKIITNDWTEEAFLTEDPRLRILCNYDEGTHNENYG